MKGNKIVSSIFKSPERKGPFEIESLKNRLGPGEYDRTDKRQLDLGGGK